MYKGTLPLEVESGQAWPVLQLFGLSLACGLL